MPQKMALNSDPPASTYGVWGWQISAIVADLCQQVDEIQGFLPLDKHLTNS